MSDPSASAARKPSGPPTGSKAGMARDPEPPQPDPSGNGGPEEEQPDLEQLRQEADAGVSDHRSAVAEVARAKDPGEEVGAETRADAVEWFLSDDPEEGVAVRRLKLDVTIDPSKPIEIEWVVQALARERVQAIREETRKRGAGRRRATRSPEDDTVDEIKANLKIASEGTAYPNLRDPKVRGRFADPADAMNYRFRNKPGIIDQLAVAVLEVSGYDEADIQEITAVKS